MTEHEAAVAQLAELERLGDGGAERDEAKAALKRRIASLEQRNGGRPQLTDADLEYERHVERQRPKSAAEEAAGAQAELEQLLATGAVPAEIEEARQRVMNAKGNLARETERAARTTDPEQATRRG